MGGETIPGLVFKSTIWLVGIFAVFVPLSVRMYRKNA
jgi:hypothetical protein